MSITAHKKSALLQHCVVLRPHSSRIRNKTPIAAACLSSMAICMAQAQEGVSSNATPFNESTLHDVYIKESKEEFLSSTLIQPINVIENNSNQQFKNGLGEMLAREPGIHSSHFGAGASRPILRGLDGARAQILNNGNVVQDASASSPDHAVMLDAQQTQSFEILRGPSALIYSAGSAGGLVNAQDASIPTSVPAKGYQATVQTGLQSGNSNRQGAFALTTGSGPLALHVAAAGYHAKNYRVGSGWEQGSHVNGSFAQGESGSMGVSWIGRDAFIGLSYSRQSSRYGLPGHTHADCHPHGNHLHCDEEHGHTEDGLTAQSGDHHGHDAHHTHHEQGHEEDHVPTIQMRSHQWNARGAWLNPVQGISAVRWQANLSRYGHEELDDDVVGTQFRNRSHQWRLEMEHTPRHGFSGLWGMQGGLRNASTQGHEATVEPHATRHTALFWLERWDAGNWSVQGAARHDQQSIRTQSTLVTRKHSGTSASLLGQWRFHPGWQASVGYTHAKRLPTAEELFSNGAHLATNAWERGDNALRAERQRSWDLGLTKTSGSTSGSVNVFNRYYDDYVYGQTLDMHEGYRLLQYTQADARFTGFEWKLQQQLNRHWALHLWGDAVRARLSDGSALPRIAPNRTGVKLQAEWQAWQTHVEWVQSTRQRRVAVAETETPGLGMLHAGVRYRMPWGSQKNVEWSVQGRNLTNRLGYVHSSYIKHAAPLQGRSIHVSMKVDF